MDDSIHRRSTAAHGLNRRAFLRSAAVTGAGAAAFLAGCRSNTPSATSPAGAPAAPAAATAIFANPAAKRGGTLGYAALDPTTGWDMHASTADNTIRANENQHIKLIRHDYTGVKGAWKAGNEEAIIGELAEKWESPDPLTYNFTLRKGINWPDLDPMKGRPITAQDVKYTFDHAKLPTSVVQEWVYNNIKSVTAIDDYTVQFKTNYPNWRWLGDLDCYNSGILPKGLYEWAGGTLGPDKARSGGPWLLEDYKPGSVIIFKPNEAYRKVFGVPYVDRLNYAILAQGAPRLAAFLAKTTSIFSPAAGDVSAVQKGRPDAKSRLNQYAATSTSAVFMNTQEAPWNDVRARRALSMAVDREGWGKTLQSEFKIESGPITWGYPTWKLDPAQMPADITQWLKFNQAEAKKLIDAAGIKSSTVFDIHMYPYSATTTADGQLMVDSFAKVGVSTKLKIYEYNNWSATVYAGPYHGLLWGPDNLDRITQQLSDRLLANSHRNHSQVQDADTQKMLSDFAAAKGPADAKPIADRIQLRSVDQAFAVYKPQGVAMRFWDPALQNYDGQDALWYQDPYQMAFMWNG
ncbi:MAG: ABC transporter substrate-binding protein [Dehalococcoidia bacterium]